RRRASEAARGGARSGSLPFASGHREADLLDARLLGVEVAGHATLVHDGDAVGESQDLVQVLADQEHGYTLACRLPEVGVHRLDPAHVEAARRRGGDEDAGGAGELAAEDELLQVSAGEVARARLRSGSRHRVAVDELERGAPDRTPEEDRAT